MKEETADETFKRLGYKKMNKKHNSQNIRYYKDDYNILDFDKENKSIFKSGEYSAMYDDITMQELQAINKKVEELRMARMKIEKDKVKIITRECEDVEIECPRCGEKNIIYDVDCGETNYGECWNCYETLEFYVSDSGEVFQVKKNSIEEAIKTMEHWVEYEKNNKDKINKADDLINIQETI